MKSFVKKIYAQIHSRFYFVKEWEGNVPIPSKPYRLVFFSHYDAQGKVHDYVLHYLKALHSNNCLVIFVSTAAFLDEASVDKIKPYCFRILLRKNIGLDFGSWRMALDRHAGLLKNSSGLLLVNDSCFGPLFNIEPILLDFEKKNNSLSGITLNYEVSTHLQSYFLYIPPPLYTSKFFKDFMQGIQYLKDKNRVIYEYEIGISTFALKYGIPLNAWVDNDLLEKTSKGVDGKRNLTIWYSDLLLEKKLSPFIKKAVFTDSAHLIANQNKAIRKTLLSDYPEYAAMIKQYLQ